MDIDMPEMDGLTATRAIRAAHPQARIVIVTSHNTARLPRRGEEAGAAGFISKDDLPLLASLLAANTTHENPSSNPST